MNETSSSTGTNAPVEETRRSLIKGITQAELGAEAPRLGVGSAPRVINEVRTALQRWPEVAEAAGLSKAQTQAIGAQHQLLIEPKPSRV